MIRAWVERVAVALVYGIPITYPSNDTRTGWERCGRPIRAGWDALAGPLRARAFDQGDQSIPGMSCGESAYGA